MALFRGMARSDYQDLLRSVGRYCDENGFTRIRIVETEDGLVVQGMVSKSLRGEKHMETYLLTPQDLRALRDANFTNRQSPPA